MSAPKRLKRLGPIPGKRVTIEDEDYVALDQLARERRMTFQQFADEAFQDLLKKHHHPTGPKDALRESAGRPTTRRRRPTARKHATRH